MTTPLAAPHGKPAAPQSRELRTFLPRRDDLPSSSDALSSSSVNSRLCFQFAMADTALARAARFPGSGPLVTASRESAGAAPSAPGERSDGRFWPLLTEPGGSLTLPDFDGVAVGGVGGSAAAAAPFASCRVRTRYNNGTTADTSARRVCVR